MWIERPLHRVCQVCQELISLRPARRPVDDVGQSIKVVAAHGPSRAGWVKVDHGDAAEDGPEKGEQRRSSPSRSNALKCNAMQCSATHLHCRVGRKRHCHRRPSNRVLERLVFIRPRRDIGDCAQFALDLLVVRHARVRTVHDREARKHAMDAGNNVPAESGGMA